LFSLLSGIGNVKPWSLEQDGDWRKKATGRSMAYRASSYWLIAKALLKIKLLLAIQTSILISRHLYFSFI
jgi:hypothetical protein